MSHVTLSLLDNSIKTQFKRDSTSSSSSSASNSQVGPRLWLSFWATLIGCPFVYGWNLGVTNLPGKHVKCWIQNVGFNNDNSNEILDCSNNSTEYAAQPELYLADAEKIWAFTVGVFGIGAMIGALSGGKFADKFGRKTTMKWNTLLSVIACLMQFCSKVVGRYEFLVLGRVLIGISSECRVCERRF